MNNDTFYQLLDRELPRVIKDATALVSAARKRGFNGCRDFRPSEVFYDGQASHPERIRDLDFLYPASGCRPAGPAGSNRAKWLGRLRREIGQLSVAFAISEYQAFASQALSLLEEEFLKSNLLFPEDWYTSYCFENSPGNEWRSRLSIVEIILAVDLLCGLEKIQEFRLNQLRFVLRKRLEKIGKDGPQPLDRDLFAWTLERVVLSLFLKDDLTFDKVLAFFKGSLTEALHQLFDSREGRNSKRCGISKLVFCSDCYFAIGHWLSVRQGGINTVVKAELKYLERIMATGPFEELHRGAWVPEDSRSKSEMVLKNSTILLISGDTLHRLDLINSWLDTPCSPKCKTQLMTQPLLWFGAEDWGYPFTRFGSSRRPLLGRI